MEMMKKIHHLELNRIKQREKNGLGNQFEISSGKLILQIYLGASLKYLF